MRRANIGLPLRLQPGFLPGFLTRSAWLGLAGCEIALSVCPYHRPRATHLAPGRECWVFGRKLPDALRRQADSATELGKGHEFFGHRADHRRNPCVMASTCASLSIAIPLGITGGAAHSRRRFTAA